MKKNVFVVVSLVTFFLSSAFAVQFEKVELADKKTIAGEELVLNGYGMRQVTRFGFDVNVYIGALYLKTKNKDETAIVQSDDTKHLVMHFVRNVDAEALLDGFRSGYYDTCIYDCINKSKQFGEFAKHVRNVRSGNEIRLTFYKDKLDVEVTGPNANKATVLGSELSKNLLNIYINKTKPPGKKFREGLLGL